MPVAAEAREAGVGRGAEEAATGRAVIGDFNGGMVSQRDEIKAQGELERHQVRSKRRQASPHTSLALEGLRLELDTWQRQWQHMANITRPQIGSKASSGSNHGSVYMESQHVEMTADARPLRV